MRRVGPMEVVTAAGLRLRFVSLLLPLLLSLIWIEFTEMGPCRMEEGMERTDWGDLAAAAMDAASVAALTAGGGLDAILLAADDIILCVASRYAGRELGV